VINVGTATIAAFIGAGGYGERIVTGLALNDNTMLLAGAIPAAALALLVQGVFELADRWLVPAGLRTSNLCTSRLTDRSNRRVALMAAKPRLAADEAPSLQTGRQCLYRTRSTADAAATTEACRRRTFATVRGRPEATPGDHWGNVRSVPGAAAHPRPVERRLNALCRRWL
jgi:hypothetical protein